MANSATGEIDHALLHDFEAAVQRLARIGITGRTGERIAWYAALRLNGPFNSAEAWTTVDKVLPKEEP